MTHVGVDLRERFCYMTALASTNRSLSHRRKINSGRARLFS